MVLFKKLFFAPLFLLMLFASLSAGNLFLKDFNIIFSFDINVFYQMLIFSSMLFFAGIFFSTFVTLSQNMKITAPVILLAAAMPFLVFPQVTAAILATGILAVTILQYLILKGRLNSYINFRPGELLSSGVKDFTGMVVIVFTVTYFLSANTFITQNGFQLPDSIFDMASKLVPLPDMQNNTQIPDQLPISKEQIETLKQNPKLLAQFGLNPNALDTLTTGQKGSAMPSPKEFLKQTFNSQIQELIKPYQHFIPIILSIFFFFTLRSILSIFFIAAHPLLWAIFLLLEKTGFISFTKEMREVRKIVVS